MSDVVRANRSESVVISGNPGGVLSHYFDISLG
jgi:hypothetical protein